MRVRPARPLFIHEQHEAWSSLLTSQDLLYPLFTLNQTQSFRFLASVMARAQSFLFMASYTPSNGQ